MLIDTKVKGSPLAQQDRAQSPDNSTTADLSTLKNPSFMDIFREGEITRGIPVAPLTKDGFVTLHGAKAKIGDTEISVELSTAA